MRISDWSSDVCSSDLNGRITSLSGALAMRPTSALTFELGAVYNHSRVDDLSPQILPVFAAAPARLGRIPNVASHAVRGSINYATMVGDEDFRVDRKSTRLNSSH